MSTALFDTVASAKAEPPRFRTRVQRVLLVCGAVAAAACVVIATGCSSESVDARMKGKAPGATQNEVLEYGVVVWKSKKEYVITHLTTKPKKGDCIKVKMGVLERFGVQKTTDLKYGGTETVKKSNIEGGEIRINDVVQRRAKSLMKMEFTNNPWKKTGISVNAAVLWNTGVLTRTDSGYSIKPDEEDDPDWTYELQPKTKFDDEAKKRCDYFLSKGETVRVKFGTDKAGMVTFVATYEVVQTESMFGVVDPENPQKFLTEK